MSDLVLASIFLALLSLAIFVAVAWGARRLPKRMCDVLAAALVILLGYYVRDVWDNMSLARWLPVSNLIILGNWFPLGIAILAGLAWNRVPPPWVRKVFITLALFGTAAFSVYFPFRGQPPHCDNIWEDGVCRQTTQATCSAASAATLLRLHGIEATEQEMADLCITRRGTSWLGLYRGLKLKTSGTPWNVQVVTGADADPRNTPPDGQIIFCRLTARLAEQNPRFQQSGWIVGMSHSVVLLAVHDDGTCDVGDPAVGRERWPMSDLQQLYERRGMRLVKR